MKKLKAILHLVVYFVCLHSYAQIVQNGNLVDSFTNERTASDNYALNDIKYKKISHDAVLIVRNFQFHQDSLNTLHGGYFDSVSISKFSINGDKIWEKKHPLTDGGRINDFLENREHELLLVGDIGTENVFIKLDSSGNILQTKAYPNPDSMMSFKTITDDKQGNYIIYSNKTKYIGSVYCYYFMYSSLTEYHNFLTKIDLNGDTVWSTLINVKKLYHYWFSSSSFIYNIPIIEVIDSNTINYLDNFTDINGSWISIKLLQLNNDGTIINEKPLIDNLENTACYSSGFSTVKSSQGYHLFVDESTHDTGDKNYLLQYRFSKDGLLQDTIRQIHPGLLTDSNETYFINYYTSEYNNIFTDVELGENHYSNIAFNGSDPIYQYNLLKSDKDYNLKWAHFYKDNNIRSYEMPFITSINDSTLLLASIVYKNDLSDSVAYLKFYTVSTKANQLIYDVYIDRNDNGLHDDADSVFTDGVIVLNDSSITTPTSLPVNLIFVDTGTYVSRLVNYDQRLKYYSLDPDSVVTVFNSLGNTDTIHFRLVPQPNIRDLQVCMVATAPPRPGFNSQYEIIARNIGTNTIEAVSLRFLPDSLQTYIQSNIAPDHIINDTLVWLLDSLTRFETREFLVQVSNQMPPILNAGDTLHLYAAVAPTENDSFLPDNQYFLRQLVVNSADPNDKAEAHEGGITTQELNQRDFLYYTIRFQNTGTTAANMVTVKDTLSTALDWNTFEMLSASHSYQLSVTGKRYITWNFSNIYLPDSTSDEPGSHGYIHCRIKPVAGLTPDDVITNRAAVYFDYNPPVITNTVTTQILQPRVTSVATHTIKSISVYPNPTNDLLTLDMTVLKPGKYTIQLCDLNGKTVYNAAAEWSGGKVYHTVSLLPLSNGIYLLRLYDSENKGLYTCKVVKQ